MTITTYTDREIALQKRVAELETENLRLCGEVSNRNKRALEGDKAQAAFEQIYLESEQLRQQLAKAQALIEASRKQEPVAWKYTQIQSGYTDVSLDYPEKSHELDVLEIESLFAAPVVAPDVPTEITEVAQVAIENVLREYNYPANPKNAARAGCRACRLHIAAMGGAND